MNGIGKFRPFLAIILLNDHTLETVLMPTLELKGKQRIRVRRRQRRQYYEQGEQGRI